MKRLAFALGAAVMAAGAVRAAETAQPLPELARALVGWTAGTPIACVNSRHLTGPEWADEHHLVYRQDARHIWVNSLRARCDLLSGDNNVLVFPNERGDDVCERDAFKVQGQNGKLSTSSCSLGKFTPYSRGAE